MGCKLTSREYTSKPCQASSSEPSASWLLGTLERSHRGELAYPGFCSSLRASEPGRPRRGCEIRFLLKLAGPRHLDCKKFQAQSSLAAPVSIFSDNITLNLDTNSPPQLP